VTNAAQGANVCLLVQWPSSQEHAELRQHRLVDLRGDAECLATSDCPV